MIKMNLRLPDDLRDELARRASSAKRSINSEIIFRLDLSLRFERDLLEAAIEEDLLEAATDQELDIKRRRSTRRARRSER
jgi:hypothetical protein